MGDYVREFHRDVMTNEDFLQQIQDHLVAIQGPSAEDPWWPEKAPLFALELSSGDDWSVPGTNPLGMNPLMPTLRARAADIQKQLDALDQGTVPRPLEDIESSEVCVNWESPEARKSPEGCPQNCMYDGCHRPELTIPSYCNLNEGTRVHGILDDRCNGMANLASYDGMEGFEGSEQPPFCWNVEIGPVKMAECPPFLWTAATAAMIVTASMKPILPKMLIKRKTIPRRQHPLWLGLQSWLLFSRCYYLSSCEFMFLIPSSPFSWRYSSKGRSMLKKTLSDYLGLVEYGIDPPSIMGIFI